MDAGLHEVTQHEPLTSITRATKVKALIPVAQRQHDINVAALVALNNQTRQRRERRDKQRRYRKQQRDMMFNLEEENYRLRKDISQLQEKQQRVLARTLPGSTYMWSVVAEYFRLFEFGLLEQKPTQQQQPSSDAVGVMEQSSDQLSFLRSTLTCDVVSNEGRGVGAVIYSWRRASFWLNDFKLELQGLHKGGASSVVATTKTTFTITERTLRNVFPSVWKDRESPLGSSLVQKLLGKSIAMCGTTRFEWDPASCRLMSVLAQSDLLTPLLRLLGSLNEVECVFAKALISPDFRLVVRS